MDGSTTRRTSSSVANPEGLCQSSLTTSIFATTKDISRTRTYVSSRIALIVLTSALMGISRTSADARLRNLTST